MCMTRVPLSAFGLKILLAPKPRNLMKRRMLVLLKRAAKPVKPTVKAGQEGDQVKAGQAEEDGGQEKG